MSLGSAPVSPGSTPGVRGLRTRARRVIVGVGTDLVGVVRFEQALARTPRAAAARVHRRRAGGPLGRAAPAALPRGPVRRQGGGREGARRAPGWGWHDAEVVLGPNGRPLLRVTGSLAPAADAQAVTAWHVSLTHDADLAVAIVVAERSTKAICRDRGRALLA